MHLQKGISIKTQRIFFYNLKFTEEKRLSRVGSASGSASQRYGSEDPDPHPYQNVNCLLTKGTSTFTSKIYRLEITWVKLQP